MSVRKKNEGGADSGWDWLREDTEEFAVLGFGPHAAELLFVAAEAPGVVTDLLRAQTAVAVQHLEGDVGVDLLVQPGTLQLCETVGRRNNQVTGESHSDRRIPERLKFCPPHLAHPWGSGEQ